MADFLGLGVMFSAIDKGLKKSLDDTVMGFNKVSNSLSNVEKAGAGSGDGKGGVFSEVIEGMKLISISRIGGALEDIHGQMVGTQQISTSFFNTLESAGAKVRSALDPKQAQLFTSSMRLGMMTPEQLETLSSGILKFGFSGQEAAKVFPMMSDLVGKVGMDASQVANMFGLGLRTLRATPGEIKGVIKETAKMQKAFGLTDQLDNLPQFFEIASANAAKFGKVNSDVTLRTVGSLSRLSMQFQRMGKSQDGAASAAVDFAGKLGTMESSILDMQAGLAPTDRSIFDLQQALTIIPNMSGKDAMDLITQNLKRPDQMIAKIRGSMKGLSDQKKIEVTQRLRRILGDTAANAISAYGDDIDKVNATADKESSKMGTADAEYRKLTKTLGGTLAKHEQLLANQKELFNVAKINAMRGDIDKYLNNQIIGWGNLTATMNDNESVMGKVLVQLYKLKELGLLGFIDNSSIHTLGIFAGVLGGLFFSLVNLTGMFKIAAAAFTLFGKPLVWIASKVMPGLIAKGDSIFDVFRAIGLHIKEKFGPIFKNVGKFFSRFGKYIADVGSKFMKVLMPAVRAFGRQLAKFVMPALRLLMRYLIGPIITAISAVVGGFSSAGVGIALAVIAIIAAIVGLVVYWDEVKQAASDFGDYIVYEWDKMWAFIDRGIEAFKKDASFSGMLDFIFSEFTGFFEGIEKGMNKMFEIIDGAIDAFKNGGWSGVGKYFAETFGGVILSIEKAWDDMWDDLFTGAKTQWTKISQWASDKFKELNPFSDDKPKPKPAPSGVKGLPSTAPTLVPPKVKTTVEEPGFFSSIFGGSDTSSPESPKMEAKPSMKQVGAPSEANRPLSINMQEKSKVADRNIQKLIDEVYDSKIVLAALLQELVIKSGSKVRITGDMKKLFKTMNDMDKDVAGRNGMGHAFNG